MSELDGELLQSAERRHVILAMHGDDAAFRALVEIYDRRLLYFIRRVLGDSEDALDVLQTVWLMVHRNLRRLNAPSAFRVWLYRIAHRQIVSALRKSANPAFLFDEVDPGEIFDETANEASFENAELVHIALQALSVPHRQVLTLRFLEDMDLAEIAEILECTPGTVKSRLHYAREALRRRIEELLND